MDSSQLILLLIGISLPAGAYLWMETRRHNPAVRWRQLAPIFGLEFQPGPARVMGRWKDRDVALSARGDGMAILSAPLACPHAVRLEIGPRAEVERDAGIIVPDRVAFGGPGDAAFEKRFLVRATPPELGETAIDPAWRQRLLGMRYARILAAQGRLNMLIPVPFETGELRDWLDLAASLADSLDGA